MYVEWFKQQNRGRKSRFTVSWREGGRIRPRGWGRIQDIEQYPTQVRFTVVDIYGFNMCFTA